MSNAGGIGGGGRIPQGGQQVGEVPQEGSPGAAGLEGMEGVEGLQSPAGAGSTNTSRSGQAAGGEGVGQAAEAGEVVNIQHVASGLEGQETDQMDTTPRADLRGPNTQSNHSDVDEAIITTIFAGQDPTNPATTPATERRLQAESGPAYNNAIASGKDYMSNPTEANQKQFIDHIDELLKQDGGVNMMEVLFLVFRESVRGVMEDQKYWLERMQEANMLADSISDYMGELVDKSLELGDKAQNAKTSKADKVTVTVEKQEFDTAGGAHFNEKGELAPPPPMSTSIRTVQRSELEKLIKDAENQASKAKNLSDRYETNFQGTDQRKNQIFQMLTTVNRTMNEMRGIGASSRSGL